MAKALQRRRGTTEEHKSFTGLEGEFTYDTTEKRIVAHDGVTVGGIPMAKKAELDSTKSELEGAIDKLAKHSVGDEWVSYTGVIPEGGVPYCGQEVTRAMYADLFAFAQAKGLVKSESEWQTIYTNQNGNVPFYGEGDGSSTFRMPRLVGYVRGASSQAESGSYVAEGLPNIEGSYRGSNAPDQPIHNGSGQTSGAFKNTHAEVQKAISTTASVAGRAVGFTFDASSSNAIYGNSSHVTPETSVVMFGVFAFGEVTNQGALDAESLAGELASVKTSYLPLEGGVTVTGPIATSSTTFLKGASDGAFVEIFGATTYRNGAYLRLDGKDSGNQPGWFTLSTGDGSSLNKLVGKPDKTLTWIGKEVERVNSSGDNYIRYENGFQICWGLGDIASGTQALTLTFPVAFVGTEKQIVVASSGTAKAVVTASSRTATSFRISSTLSDGTYNLTRYYQYIAAGYWK